MSPTFQSRGDGKSSYSVPNAFGMKISRKKIQISYETIYTIRGTADIVYRNWCVLFYELHRERLVTARRRTHRWEVRNKSV